VLHHLAHLVVHGTLHLLGHDHDLGVTARRMETAEARILNRLGFPDPYGDRTVVRARARARKRA
jgi:probable rRNA maturation factor